MRHINLSSYICLLLLILHGMLVTALPAMDNEPPVVSANHIEGHNKLPPEGTSEGSIEAAVAASNASEASEVKPTVNIVTETQEQPMPSDNVASASNYDGSTIYATGVIPPEIFQQYLNQYGAAAYAPYVGAAYPAPIAGAPGPYPYPGHIVVQTGYEGYVAPTTAVPGSTSSTTEMSTTTAAPSSNPLMSFISNLLPTILMSTLFRIAAVVLSAVGFIFFGGAITNTLCRLTPVCNFPHKAVDYLRSGGAEDVGRLLADEMTPERVKRATDFVRTAIRKYRLLQKMAENRRE